MVGLKYLTIPFDLNTGITITQPGDQDLKNWNKTLLELSLSFWFNLKIKNDITRLQQDK